MTNGVIRGDDAFFWEYQFKDEPDYLVEMARQTGAGICRLEAYLECEDTLWLTPQMEVEGRSDIGRVFDELCRVIQEADSQEAWETLWQDPGLARNDLESLADEDGTVETIVRARAQWQVNRDAWPTLLDYINSFIDQPLTLDDFDSPMSPALIDADALLEESGAGDYLPLLALAALEHAVIHQVDTLQVWEDEPSSWQQVKIELPANMGQ